jgi:hypothetical protein
LFLAFRILMLFVLSSSFPVSQSSCTRLTFFFFFSV